MVNGGFLKKLLSPRKTKKIKIVRVKEKIIKRRNVGKILNQRKRQTLMRIIESPGASPVAKARARRLLES